MKKLLLLLSLFAVYCSLLPAQNLVPNPSFEEYTICHNNYFMLPTDWYSCSATPDYFNSCDSTGNYSVPNNGDGNQIAFNGVGYVGLYTVYYSFMNGDYKEYIGCMLKSPLIIGVKYYISFHVSLADISNCASNNIGLLFSTKSYQDYQPYDSSSWDIPTNNYAQVNCTSIISDKQNWSEIKGSIIADSAYQYINIGNFFDKNHTDTLMYNNYPGYAFYYIDDIYVGTDSIETVNYIKDIQQEIDLFPNPALNIVNIKWNNSLAARTYYMVYDVYGKLIWRTENIEKEFSIDVSEFPKGIYIMEIIVNDKTFFKKFIINANQGLD